MASSFQHLLLTIILSTSYLHYAHSQLVDCSSTTECRCPDVPTPGEKCILNCNTEDSCKSSILHCRAGDPCEIRCEAKSACAQDTNIKGTTATDVTLICNGEDTCKSATQLHCGTGDCLITCQGKASCDGFGQILISSSTNSFQCSGNCPLDIPTQFTASPSTTTTTSPTSSPTIPAQTTWHPSTQPTSIPTMSTVLLSSTQESQMLTSVTSSVIQTAIHKISTALSTTQNMILPSDQMSEDRGTVLMLHLDDIHPLYYGIALLLVLIFGVLCCALFCWIYTTHRRTQTLIKQQQARLDSKSPNFGNVPRTFNGFPAFKSPDFDVQQRCLSDTIIHHDTGVCSPTMTSDDTQIHPHAAPRMYRIHSAETTPVTVVQKHFTKRKKMKREGNESSDSETTDSDTSNGLSKEIWEENDGVTMTTAHDMPTLPAQTTTKLPTYNTRDGYHVPPPPPLPVVNVSDKMKSVSHPSQYYNYTMAVRHLQQLQHALQYGPQIRPSITEAPNTAHSDLSRCTESYAINSSILQHMNTEETQCGEAYEDSMIAVRHPTISHDPYECRRCSSSCCDHQDRTRYHVHIKSADSIGFTDERERKTDETEIHQVPHVGQDEVEKVMKLQMHEEDVMSQSSNRLKRKMKNEMDNILVLQKRVVIDIPEIPEEISKSFKSYSMEKSQKTPPKEFSTDCFNEDPNDLDRNSYAIQLVGVDEPTLTEYKSHSKTVEIEDTYLKFLNI